MMPYKCFLLTQVPKVRLSLRRYRSAAGKSVVPCPNMPGEYSYHDIMVHLTDFDWPVSALGETENWNHHVDHELTPPKDDARWPTHCSCGLQWVFKHSHPKFKFGSLVCHGCHVIYDVTPRDMALPELTGQEVRV